MSGKDGGKLWQVQLVRNTRGKPELRGDPQLFCWQPLSPNSPRDTGLSSSFPSPTRPFPSPLYHPSSPLLTPRSPYLGTLPLQPSSLMHTAPSTELCHSQIPAAPSTSAHRRLPPYPASRCLAHRGSPTALVLKQRQEGKIRLDTQLCRGRMNVGFF